MYIDVQGQNWEAYIEKINNILTFFPKCDMILSYLLVYTGHNLDD